DVTVALGFPPDAFFTFVGAAGHIVIGLPAAALKVGAIECQRAAVRAGHGAETEIDRAGANFACDSYVARDGTGSTTISVLKISPKVPPPAWRP
ncbi:MAG: hypothetical protein WA020_15325, partial [Candidatus Acidiferrales bacterium]